MLLLLEHRFEPGAQGESGLAGARATPERHNSDVGIEQHVDGEALFCRAAVKTENVAITAHETQSAAAGHPAESRTAIGVDDEPGVDGQIGD